MRGETTDGYDGANVIKSRTHKDGTIENKITCENESHNVADYNL